MKKFTHKLIALVLCLAMIGGMLPMGASAEGNDTVYTLYPTPHEIAYGEGSFELTGINAIYGEGIDEYTEARLEETAALLDLAVAESGETDVYVAIYGSGDEVESYILNNYTVDTTLFEKIDANFVAVNNGEIVVLGKDTDACFYGLTTLYQIFGQLGGKTIRNLTINDYADVVSRGFIEGYYGNPWSVEDRAALMEWGGYYKLNSYFYAPKDDPKHNSKWRELYTDEELETLIRPLAEAGNASKCRYVFALHPFMHNPIRFDTDAHYNEDIGILKAKFTQVIECGVRQIAILADDAGTVGAANNQRVLVDMCNWLEEMQQTYPDLKLNLPFVAPGFEYAGYGESYYRNFPENVQIVMTGGQVWGYVTQGFVDRFYNNVGRGPYMWINWPCSDNSKNHLIMGGYADWLYPGVSPEKIQGIVLNPMQQSEPSKVAIFGNACYSWNIWESRAEADAAWEASFSCVNHKSIVPNEASEAFKELCKHMINQAMTNGVVNLQESVAIKDELNNFKTALTNGTYTHEAIASLREEFEILQQAAITFRNEGDQRLAGQIVYWLNCWDDTTAAAIAYLDALDAILDGAPGTDVWGHYAIGQSAWESSRNHPLWYIDHWEYAEVGVQHIVPFMRALHNYLSTYVLDIVDPSGGLAGGGSGGGSALTLTPFDGNKPGYYQSYTLSNVTDGNLSTAVWYNDVAQAGQYIGVDLGKAVKLGTVTFTQDSGDRFVSYELQYSTNGTSYTTYNTYTDAVLNVDLAAEGIVARYVRFVGSDSNGKWVKIYEINVTEAPTTGVMTNRAELESLTTRIVADRGELVSTGSITLSPNEYLGLDLGRIKDLSNVTATDKGALTLQVSVNNLDWVNIESGEVTEDGRYVRLINLTEADVTVNLTEFSATSNEVTGVTLHSSDIGINASWGVAEDCRENGAAFDGDVNSITEFGDFVSAGQYIIYDLGQTLEIEKLEIYCNDSAVNYIRDAVIQISMDMNEWTDVLTIGDGVQNTGEDSVTCINSDAGYSQATSSYPNKVSIEGTVEKTPARYLRILMTAANTERAVVFNEIEINNGEYVSVSNDPTFEVSAIEVQGYPPQNMVDGDLTTSWKPNTTEAGSMVYTFSDNLELNRINIVSKTASGARVYLLAENDGVREWIDKGVLDKSLITLIAQNDLNLALKVEWDADSVPNITEIVRFSEEVVCEHEFGEWHVTTEPTCTKTGVETRSCQLCGTDETRSIPAVGHGAEETIPAVAPTCTETGLTEGKKCSVCGVVTVPQEVVAALGHEYTAVVTAPTCTKSGYTTYTCRCGDSYVADYAPALGHQYEAVVTAPTCTEGGYTTYTCTGCGRSYVGDETPALGHNWVDGSCSTCGCPYSTFSDVPADAYFFEAVEWAVSRGITSGTSDTTFSPDSALLREQFVTMLWRAAGSPEPESYDNPFTDVAEGDYFYKAVLWAVENGVTNGVSDTEFGVSQVTTRAQVVTFLWANAGNPEASGSNSFTDVVPGEWYEAAVNWAVEQGITSGMTPTTFGVTVNCTRAHAVTFLYKALGQ